MEWLKKSVWQMGIGALLVMFGSWLAYTNISNGENESMINVGLYIIFAGLFIPLLIKIYSDSQNNNGKN